MTTINERIRKSFYDLTASQKLVAHYILDNPKSIALYPAKEIGTLTNTSETTVIRFCYSLGYSGFSELQEEVRKTYLTKSEEKDALITFREEMEEEISSEKYSLKKIMLQEIQSIKSNFEELNEEMILAAITSIIEAERIVVVGLRSSHSAAHWLSFTLNIIKGNTFLYRGEIDDANYMIGQLNSNSVVIALSFPRYAQETLQIVKGAKSQGAKIIGITDEYLTPFGQEIDILLKVVTPKPTSFKGMTVVFFLLNILMNGVMVKDWENIQDRLKNYESTTGKFFPFIQVDE